MLRVRDLSITLGQFALDEVDLCIGQGRYFCLAGPTGAGKTILLECIAGLHTPSDGRVYVNGIDVTELPPEVRRVGYVPQDYALFPHMDVFDNIAYGLVERGAAGADIARKVHSTADLLQISHLLERRTGTLSGGERQRVALARTLVLDCRLLLLDEPLSALDAVTSGELTRYLGNLHRRLGLTVLHVTHDFTEACALADDIGICYGGRLLQTGAIGEVFAAPVSRTVANFLGVANIFPSVDCDLTSCSILNRLQRQLACSRPDGHCVCIRPDQVRVTRRPQAHGEFVAEGTIKHVRWLGQLYELILDVGVPLTVTLSTQEQQSLNCRAGDRVFAAFDGRAVRVLRDE